MSGNNESKSAYYYGSQYRRNNGLNSYLINTFHDPNFQKYELSPYNFAKQKNNK